MKAGRELMSDTGNLLASLAQFEIASSGRLLKVGKQLFAHQTKHKNKPGVGLPLQIKSS